MKSDKSEFEIESQPMIFSEPKANKKLQYVGLTLLQESPLVPGFHRRQLFYEDVKVRIGRLAK
jgi:hypothetical protein